MAEATSNGSLPSVCCRRRCSLPASNGEYSCLGIVTPVGQGAVSIVEPLGEGFIGCESDSTGLDEREAIMVAPICNRACGHVEKLGVAAKRLEFLGFDVEFVWHSRGFLKKAGFDRRDNS